MRGELRDVARSLKMTTSAARILCVVLIPVKCPQGLFMLQVAFGQRKYYSDTLPQNIMRGSKNWLRIPPFAEWKIVTNRRLLPQKSAGIGRVLGTLPH